jgi:hypothetical protein
VLLEHICRCTRRNSRRHLRSHAAFVPASCYLPYNGIRCNPVAITLAALWPWRRVDLNCITFLGGSLSACPCPLIEAPPPQPNARPPMNVVHAALRQVSGLLVTNVASTLLPWGRLETWAGSIAPRPSASTPTQPLSLVATAG